MIEERKKIQ